MDSLRANWRHSEIWVSSGGCIRGKGYWPWEVRQSWSVSHNRADLLISVDRTRFPVCTWRLASEGLARNQGRFTHCSVISAHSRLPGKTLQPLKKSSSVSWACVESYCSEETDTVSNSCMHLHTRAHKEALWNWSLKPELASKWVHVPTIRRTGLHLQVDALTYQMQPNLDISAQRCRMIKSAAL